MLVLLSNCELLNMEWRDELALKANGWDDTPSSDEDDCMDRRAARSLRAREEGDSDVSGPSDARDVVSSAPECARQPEWSASETQRGEGVVSDTRRVS